MSVPRQAEGVTRVAVLDDYQGVALKMADWSVLGEAASVAVFRDHLSEPDLLIERLRPFHVVCVMRERTRLQRPVLSQLPNLKMISTPGMRNDAIDVKAAKDLGVTVCGTPSHSQRSVVELTWGLILALARNLPNELTQVRNGGWAASVGQLLAGKTIGVVGLGRIGKAVASVAGSLQMRVVAWSQNLGPEAAAAAGAELVGKDELFSESDVVTIHLVLSERTRGLVGQHELSLMKPTSFLVNTSRGPIVDESALTSALERKAIAGAALDVYDVEPLPKAHPFRHLPNVIATPHMGYVTEEVYKEFYGDTVENVASWLRGKPVRVLDP